MARRLWPDRRDRLRRLVGPGGVQRIAVHRLQLGAGLARRLAVALRGIRRGQPGVESQHLALLEVGGDPGLGRLVDQVPDLE
jgi:hypothetical protein